MMLGKKEKIQIAVTSALAVVLLVVFRHNFAGSGLKVGTAAGKMPSAAPVPSARPAPLEREGGASVLKKLKEEAERLKPPGRDPFSRQEGLAADKGPVLSGIVWDARDPAAIINGQIVRVGDNLEPPAGHKVLAIDKNRVLLNDGERNIELMLEAEPDKDLMK
ncbi:MAG: hypothetical protein HZA28_07280 [Candidatus Omnitrophica bacterium]|nr:hypothetical protein [Candidatus Omnitrophota bacterium]